LKKRNKKLLRLGSGAPAADWITQVTKWPAPGPAGRPPAQDCWQNKRFYLRKNEAIGILPAGYTSGHHFWRHNQNSPSRLANHSKPFRPGGYCDHIFA
jgi:hypothetical protein